MMFEVGIRVISESRFRTLQGAGFNKFNGGFFIRHS